MSKVIATIGEAVLSILLALIFCAAAMAGVLLSVGAFIIGVVSGAISQFPVWLQWIVLGTAYGYLAHTILQQLNLI